MTDDAQKEEEGGREGEANAGVLAVGSPGRPQHVPPSFLRHVMRERLSRFQLDGDTPEDEGREEGEEDECNGNGTICFTYCRTGV